MKYEEFEDIINRIHHAREGAKELSDIREQRQDFYEASRAAHRASLIALEESETALTEEEIDFDTIQRHATFFRESSYLDRLLRFTKDRFVEDATDKETITLEDFVESRVNTARTYSETLRQYNTVCEMDEKELANALRWAWQGNRIRGVESELFERIRTQGRDILQELSREYAFIQPSHNAREGSYSISFAIPKTNILEIQGEAIGARKEKGCIFINLDSADLSNKEYIRALHTSLEIAAQREQEVCSQYTLADVATFRESLIALQKTQRTVKEYARIAHSLYIPPEIPELLEDRSRLVQLSADISSRIDVLEIQAAKMFEEIQFTYGVISCDLHSYNSGWDDDSLPSEVRFYNGSVTGDCRDLQEGHMFYQGYVIDKAVKYFQEQIASSL